MPTDATHCRAALRLRSTLTAAEASRPARAVLLRHGMHFISFAFKRAHYSSLRASRDLARKFGLTPARFDLLACLRKDRYAFQAELARVLGVSEATISRMVGAMEKAGLVRLVPHLTDRRIFYVRFTKQGRRRFYLVLRRLQRRPLQRRFVGLLPEWVTSPVDDPHAGSNWMASFGSALRAVCKQVGDHSTLRYPDWDLLAKW